MAEQQSESDYKRSRFKRCGGTHWFHLWRVVMFTGYAEILVCDRCGSEAVRG